MNITPFSNEQAQKLWNDKFTFFWYNEPEVFLWTQEDFDRQAKTFHDNGITIVMTFSVFHFRGTFVLWRKEILEAIRKICTACHKFGIRVMEHHSCALTYHIETEDDWKAFCRYFELHNSNAENFTQIKSFFEQGLPLKGHRLADCLQLDGRTGLPATSGYHGNSFCYNNPTYRKLYLEYVDDLKDTGIDCLLADDIQYFGSGNACTCPHCRKRFKEQTGYDLPDPRHWDEFFQHCERPDFIAWLKFKVSSTADWQNTLTEHYRKIGLNSYRANYRSDLLASDSTANAFTIARDSWAQVFQENCLSEIIRYSWPHFYCESLVQYAVAKQKNSASMSLFYPTRYDQYYFAWALSQSWGQLPFLCPEGANMTAEDHVFNQFEQKHQELFRAPIKQPDLAFLISRESFDFTPWKTAAYDNYFPTHGVMQGAYFNNLVSDAILEDQPLEDFLAQDCLVAVSITRVSQDLARKLLQFVQSGRRLIILGKFAVYDPPADIPAILASPGTRRFLPALDPDQSQRTVWQIRMYEEDKAVKAPMLNVQSLKETYGELLADNLPAPRQIAQVPQGYLAQLYRLSRKEHAWALHLLKTDGLLQPQDTLISHDDPIQPFTAGASENPHELTITLNRSGFTQARLLTPETEDSLPLKVSTDHQQTTLTIPGGTFAGYAIIELND